MDNLSETSFGLVIAYLIPGFLLMASVSLYSPIVATWLGTAPADAPTVGGFVFATLASIGAGLVLSAARWLTLDAVHHANGIEPGSWDYARFQENREAFAAIVENHYRYYQFYGNTLLASFAAFGLSLPHASFSTATDVSFAIGMLLLTVLLYVSSRDALMKYYARARVILSPAAKGTSNDQRSSSESEASR